MTFHGSVRNGVVVLDQPAELPEGAEVTVLCHETTDVRKDRPLMRFAGQITDLPPDASRMIDRVLYGEQKP